MSDEELYIRQATLNDIQDIMYIEENAFISGVVEHKDSFIERISAFPEGFLLLKNPASVGYFCAELWEDILIPPYTAEIFTLGHSAQESHKPDGTILYISSMGVLSSCRGQGLGGYLFNGALTSILEHTPHIKRILLLVNEKWNAARAIYQKAGFSQVAVLPQFFENTLATGGARQNGIVMEKIL